MSATPQVSHVSADVENIGRSLQFARLMMQGSTLSHFEANPEAATVCRDHAAAIVEQFEACGLIQKAKRR